MSQSQRRSNLILSCLEGFNGWNRDPYAAGVVIDWNYRFPGLDIVSDSRKVTGHTRNGRGTTSFDLFRKVGDRADFLSVKTETITPKGGFPSKISLSTGNLETLEALINGIQRGNALPTVIFASKLGEDGPEDDGAALFLDLGPLIRNGIKTAPEGGFKKGTAPPVYFKWSSRRKCGGKKKLNTRSDLEFPHYDEQGRKWSAPEYVHYRELVVSLYALGIKKDAWVPCNVSEVPSMCERENWSGMAYGPRMVG